jgi:hypothetical protein
MRYHAVFHGHHKVFTDGLPISRKIKPKSINSFHCDGRSKVHQDAVILQVLFKSATLLIVMVMYSAQAETD